jgi:hypothetical protein
VVQWQGAGSASVVSAQGTAVVLRSDRPFPPGAPAQGDLTTRTPSHAFTLKVAGSRKVAEGIWEVRGKLQTAPSDLIAAFAAAAVGASPGNTGAPPG